MEIKPWKKIGKSEVIAERRGKRLMLQKLEDPYTNQVEEFFQFSTTLYACIILPLTIDNNVLAVRQYRHGAHKVLLELPGGNPSTPEQTQEEVAEEELLEETSGYKAQKLIKLNDEPLWADPANFTVPFHAFLALSCRQTTERKKLDKGEYLELVKIPFNIWLSMCTNSEIVDAKSTVVTFLAIRHLGLKITR